MRTSKSPKRVFGLVAAAAIGAACADKPVFASPTQNGGSGLFFAQTAETTMDANADFFVLGRMDDYDLPPPSKNDLDVVIAPGVNYGLSDTTEIGLLVSALENETTSTSGIQRLQGHLKHRYFGGNDGQWAGAFNLFAAVGNDQAELSSGDPSYGLEFNFSYLSGPSGLHLALGYEQSDTKQLLTYDSEPKATAAAGFGFVTSSNTLLSFEFIAKKGLDTQDENIFFVPGLRYRVGSFEYGVGVSIGLPEDRSAPQHSYFAQISYSTGEPRPWPAPMEAAVRAIKADTAQIALSVEQQTERLAEQSEQLADLESRLLNMGTIAAVTSDAMVEIVADAGLSDIAKQVSNRLRSKGYRVSPLRSSAAQPAKETWIYYRPGFAQDAVRLGNAIPRNQNVAKDPNLPIDVDIRIVIGEDLSNTPGANVKVEIWANPDVADAAARVSELLHREGYLVINTRESTATSIDETWIRYRLGRAGDAIKLGKLLPRNQTLVKDPTLPENIDIRIVLGRDQVQAAP